MVHQTIGFKCYAFLKKSSLSKHLKLLAKLDGTSHNWLFGFTCYTFFKKNKVFHSDTFFKKNKVFQSEHLKPQYLTKLSPYPNYQEGKPVSYYFIFHAPV